MLRSPPPAPSPPCSLRDATALTSQLAPVADRARHRAGDEADRVRDVRDDRRVAEGEQDRERDQRARADDDVDAPAATPAPKMPSVEQARVDAGAEPTAERCAIIRCPSPNSFDARARARARGPAVRDLPARRAPGALRRGATAVLAEGPAREPAADRGQRLRHRGRHRGDRVLGRAAPSRRRRSRSRRRAC